MEYNYYKLMLVDENIPCGAYIGYKITTERDINSIDVLEAFIGDIFTRDKSLGNQIRINIGIATVSSLSKDPSRKDLDNAYWGATISPIVNLPFSKFNSSAANILSGYSGEYIGDLENRKRDLDKTLEKLKANMESSK